MGQIEIFEIIFKIILNYILSYNIDIATNS